MGHSKLLVSVFIVGNSFGPATQPAVGRIQSKGAEAHKWAGQILLSG